MGNEDFGDMKKDLLVFDRIDLGNDRKRYTEHDFVLAKGLENAAEYLHTKGAMNGEAVNSVNVADAVSGIPRGCMKSIADEIGYRGHARLVFGDFNNGGGLVNTHAVSKKYRL